VRGSTLCFYKVSSQVADEKCELAGDIYIHALAPAPLVLYLYLLVSVALPTVKQTTESLQGGFRRRLMDLAGSYWASPAGRRPALRRPWASLWALARHRPRAGQACRRTQTFASRVREKAFTRAATLGRKLLDSAYRRVADHLACCGGRRVGLRESTILVACPYRILP